MAKDFFYDIHGTVSNWALHKLNRNDYLRELVKNNGDFYNDCATVEVIDSPSKLFRGEQAYMVTDDKHKKFVFSTDPNQQHPIFEKTGNITKEYYHNHTDYIFNINNDIEEKSRLKIICSCATTEIFYVKGKTEYKAHFDLEPTRNYWDEFKYYNLCLRLKENEPTDLLEFFEAVDISGKGIPSRTAYYELYDGELVNELVVKNGLLTVLNYTYADGNDTLHLDYINGEITEEVVRTDIIPIEKSTEKIRKAKEFIKKFQ